MEAALDSNLDSFSPTENDSLSNKTTGVFAPVAERTVAGSPLVSTVEPIECLKLHYFG